MIYIALVEWDNGDSFIQVSSVDLENSDSDDIESNSYIVPIPRGKSPEAGLNVVRNVLCAGGAMVVMQ